MAPGRTLAAAVIAGLAAGLAVPWTRPAAAVAAALAAGSVGIVCQAAGHRRLALGVALCACAVAHGAAARDRVLDAPLAAWVDAHVVDGRTPHPVIVEGTLRSDAEQLDTGARLTVDVRSIADGDRRLAIGGRVQVFVGGTLSSESLREWTSGRTIRAPMTLRRPQVPRNPGGAAERWHVLTRGFDVSGHVKSAMLVDVSPAAWWHEAAARARAFVRRSAVDLFSSSDQTAAIVVAVLIGDRSFLDDDLERRMQVAGTYHVIAISGGNVALLTAWSFLGLRLLLRSFRWASGLTIGVVLVYGWIAGGEPSVSRAVAAAVIYLACGSLGLSPAALDVLAVVALLVATFDPLMVVDAGAWLSFGATLGIIVYVSRVAAWQTRRGTPLTSWRRAGVWGLGLAGATLAAELALLPVQAHLFSRVGVAGLLLNLLAVPMIAVVQAAGTVGIAFLHVFEPAAMGAAKIARAAAHAITGSAYLVEVAPWLSWRVPPPPGVLIGCYYGAGLVLLFPLAGSRWRRLAAAMWLASLLVVVSAPATALRKPAPGWLRLTMVDVGQGEALLLQLPGGRSLVIDAGGAGARFDAGDRIVTPAMWASGVRRLDWLLVTHADTDHIGGAAAVAATFGPREIWEGVPVPADPARRALARAADRRGIVWRTLYQDHRFAAGGVVIDVASPAAPDWERQRVRNDDSVVLRARYGDVELLLTGDIGADIERALAGGHGRAPLRVLKVAHHGSRTSSSAEFVRRYAPQVALISAGKGNPFGHPAAEVVQRLRDVGAAVFRTDTDGAVILETDGRVVEVRSIGGRRWTLRVDRRPA